MNRINTTVLAMALFCCYISVLPIAVPPYTMGLILAKKGE